MKKLYPTKLSIRLLVYVVVGFMTSVLRVRKTLPAEVKHLKAPYLVLSNHVGFWDPFFVNQYLPVLTRYISSDRAFNNPLFRYFLTRLGTIPTKKNTRDTQVIRDILTVINQGDNVGLFPEAVRNWAGSTFALDPSISKLIKHLKVPVVVVKLKGMNLFNPRWAVKRIRYTQVELEYSLLFTSEQIEQLTPSDILQQLKVGIQHDEVAYQRTHMHPIRSNHRAEHISHALYVCPNCKSIDTFDCHKNDFMCRDCDYGLHVNRYGFFELVKGDQLHFDNIRDWYNWQEEWMSLHVSEKMDFTGSILLFKDTNSLVYGGKEDEEPPLLGVADVFLYTDKITIEFQNEHPSIELNFEELKTINPQLKERLEMFYGEVTYRIVGAKEGTSALKWEVAVNTIWRKLGQHKKLSPYIRSNFNSKL